MKRIHKWYFTVISALLLFLLTGCTAIGIDIESQMRPPKNNGKQELLQMALDTYISQKEVNKYSLKYPTEGRYLSAFILLDELQPSVYISPMVSEQKEENGFNRADYCVAFYRPDTENAKTHVHLLKNTEDGWASVADIEGYGDTISQVEFGDLNGDSFPELLVGWSMYNTKDKRLHIYDIQNNLRLLSDAEIYTAIVVSDITADDVDDLLLLNIEPTRNSLSARLMSYTSDTLLEKGETVVDTDVISIGESLTAVLSKNTHGVFFDTYKNPNTTVTQLLIWENDTLQAPFYSFVGQMNTVTAREHAVLCQDVDKDGIVEWPMFSRLPGYENTDFDKTMWKTSWYYYDHLHHRSVFDFDCFLNSKDGYIIKLTDAFPENFTTSYDEKNRILEFVYFEKGNSTPISFLKIQTSATGKKSDLLDDFIYFDESESLYYAVWLQEEFSVTMEEIRYLFSVL